MILSITGTEDTGDWTREIFTARWWFFTEPLHGRRDRGEELNPSDFDLGLGYPTGGMCSLGYCVPENNVERRW